MLPKCSALSVPVILVTLASISLKLSVLSLVAGQSATIVHTFVDPKIEQLNHLVVDKNTGQVFVGGENVLYQLSPNLDLIVENNTGPKSDSIECSGSDCPTDVIENVTNNVNKVLVIDYTTPRLIACGSLSQGSCTIRTLNNISNVIQEVQMPVVADDAISSTVAFIAPGPPNPQVSQVMYVGVTYTANSSSDVPAVSSRTLDSERMLEIAETTSTTGTKMFVNAETKQKFPINYVYGFSSDGFSYFLTIQPKNTTTGSEFISKLVRVCQNDQNYYSYTEIPVECTNEVTNYNLVQAAYVGKAGSDLAGELDITTHEDVLFAVFSESIDASNKPSSKSALCVYSLKAIRRKFTSNIQNCAAGNGQTGLDFITPTILQCAPTPLQNISEDFCGLSANPILGGEDPITASPVLSFNKQLTAVAATSTGNDTVVFVGTSDGHLEKILVQTATSAVKYDDLAIDTNSPVNSDMHFDPQLKHLYVMTRQKVFKVDVQNCSVYETCSDCLGVRDPYCGWCILENKCSLRSDCEVIPNTPLHWIKYKSGECPIIASVTPDQSPKATTTNLELVVENLPRLSGRFRCAFSTLNETLVTDARRESNVINCRTPTADVLPSVPGNQHHLAVKLSIRRTIGPDLVSTNFTIFDCPTYTSCTECVTSSFPCDWCIDGHTCTHNTNENCHGDILINRTNEIGPSSGSGPEFCPRIIPVESQEILVNSGLEKAVRIRVQSLGIYILQTRFVCQFSIEGSIRSVMAQVLADRLYCDPLEFTYASEVPHITVPFAVVWGGSKTLSNPDNIHVVVYRCKYMADECGTCLNLDQKYNCGWCQSSNTCEVRNQCDTGSDRWIGKTSYCPKSEV